MAEIAIDLLPLTSSVGQSCSSSARIAHDEQLSLTWRHRIPTAYIRYGHQSDDEHDGQGTQNSDQRVGQIDQQSALHVFAVASKWSGGDIYIVAVDSLAIEKAGQADDDHRSSARIFQRAHLPPPILAAGRKPPIDRGEGNQPEAGRSRNEQNESTSLAHESIGIRQLNAPNGENAFAQAERDRNDIGDRRDEKEKGAGIPAKDGPSEDETVEKVTDHIEDEDEHGEVEIDLRGHVMERFGERDRRQIGHG